jgi:hypothetical protein
VRILNSHAGGVGDEEESGDVVDAETPEGVFDGVGAARAVPEGVADGVGVDVAEKIGELLGTTDEFSPMANKVPLGALVVT